jgi:hypothetical protein
MLKFCLYSFFITRIIYIGFIYGVYYIFNIREYDLSNGHLFDNKEIEISLISQNCLEYKFLEFMKLFYNYDSVYFINIAKNGYINDKSFAFFPTFPILIRYLSYMLDICLQFLPNFFHFTNSLTIYFICGLFISNLFCIINTLLLCK